MLGLPFCPGGELYTLLRSQQVTSEMHKFYSANVILGLEQLHEMGIVYKE